MAGHGLITTPSKYTFQTTLNRLEHALHDSGMTVFGRVDHAANAAGVDLALRPTTVLIFGNATGGTRLMQADQQVGLELPLHMLVWQDSAGAVHLTYDDPHNLAARYDLGEAALPVITAMTGLLASLAATAGA